MGNPVILPPGWPERVGVRVSTRTGGVSPAPWASLNLGDHVGDDPGRVAENRARFRLALPAEPVWLKQVHSATVARLDTSYPATPPEADAATTRSPGVVCAVLTADCLPALLCDRAGTVVAAAHAGWRGLADGVLEATLAAMDTPPGELLVWLGPAIGPDAFEVGNEVRDAFLAQHAGAAAAFRPHGDGKWLADLYALARLRLGAAGVTAIGGGGRCTFSESDTYFSYRRDGVTGRMASAIWLAA